MSLYGILNTSTSGLAAQANLLSSVSENIANSETVGYKNATVEFSTLVLQSGTGDYNSGGVQTVVQRHNSDQGTLTYTSSKTDLAIQGDGFFVVQSPDGTDSLTRAGSFTENANGDLVNAAGFKLLGYPASGGTNPVTNGFAGLVPVTTATLGPVAQPSQNGVLSVNLPVESAAITSNLPSGNAANATYTQKTSLVAYDDVGASKTLDIYETKTAANTWEISVFDRAAGTNGGFPYAGGPLTTQTLNFDPTNGNLASGSPKSVSVPVPGGKTLTIDLSKTTELSGGYSVNNARVDGSAPSAVDHVEFDASGAVSAVYKNGSRATVFQVPLATVPSPDSLELRAGNVYSPTLASGDVTISLPQTGSLGKLVSGALEKSTVDVATDLTTAIAAQRDYTANSKVFQTAADLLDVLINLKR